MREFTKTVTEKQLAANRSNGAKSQGPVTPEGREKSSQNRRWHGLAGRFTVLACEDQDAFDHLFDSFVEDEQPVGSVEMELVRKMAEYTWLRQRTTYLHNCCFRVGERTPDLDSAEKHNVQVNMPRLDLIIRYQAHYDRCYARAANELLRRRKDRQLQESRFESQNRGKLEEVRSEKKFVWQEERHNLYVAKHKEAIKKLQIRNRGDSGAQNQAIAA